MTTEHRLTEAFFQGLTKRTLTFTIPLMLLVLAGGWYMARGENDSAAVSAAILGFLLLVIGVTLVRGVQRQKRSFRSFCIRVESDRLIRIQDDYPPLEIAFADITKLSENPKGLLVQGAGHHQALFLFAGLERFDELRAGLALLRPIEVDAHRFSLLKLLALIFLPLVALIVVYRSDSPTVVVLTGGALILLLAWTVVYLVRSPHIERSTKRGLWWFIPVFFSIAAKMWYVLDRR